MTGKGLQTFAVSQKSERCYPAATTVEYSSCRVILVKDVGNKLEWVQGTTGNQERDTYLECGVLDKGTYFIFVQVDWYKLETPDPDSQFLAVNSYGAAPVNFGPDKASRIADDKLWTKAEALKQAFISKSLKGAAGVDKTDLKENDPPAPLITKFVCKDAAEGYNFTVVQNKSADQKYAETMDYTTLRGLTILDDPTA